MPETIMIELYEHRPIQFSPLTQTIKVAEINATKMTAAQLEQVFEIQEMLGRTYKIKRV